MQVGEDEFGAGVDVEFFEDAFDVLVNRPRADAKSLSDFLVDHAFAHEVNDFLFAVGELGLREGFFR